MTVALAVLAKHQSGRSNPNRLRNTQPSSRRGNSLAISGNAVLPLPNLTTAGTAVLRVAASTPWANTAAGVGRSCDARARAWTYSRSGHHGDSAASTCSAWRWALLANC